MALPLMELFEPEVVIFDCTDELSAFDFAPLRLVERERQLLKRADMVFTGGPSLYRAKQGLQPEVHLFPPLSTPSTSGKRSMGCLSPTKTLGYMAAERPIVSTPITDVQEPYSDVVYLGDLPEVFVTACERALAPAQEERARQGEKTRAVLEDASWDLTAAAMQRLTEEVREGTFSSASDWAAS